MYAVIVILLCTLVTMVTGSDTAMYSVTATAMYSLIVILLCTMFTMVTGSDTMYSVSLILLCTL